MYKMHQCAVCSVYLGKAQHHVVYDRNNFFGFGPIPKLIPKMADTFMPTPYLIKGPKIKDAAKYEIFFCRFVFNFKLFKSYISPRSEKTHGKF